MAIDKREDESAFYPGGKTIPRGPAGESGLIPPEGFEAVKRDAAAGAKHAERKGNPHGVTPEQIGAATETELSAVKNLANGARELAGSARESVQAEASRAITKEQDLAYSIANEEARAKSAEEVLRAAIAAIKTFKVVVAGELPSVGELKTIYLVPSTKSEDQNTKDEYLWINDAWERIGSTAVDLSDYAKKSEIPEKVTSATVSGWGFFKGTIETIKTALASVFVKDGDAVKPQNVYTVPDIQGSDFNASISLFDFNDDEFILSVDVDDLTLDQIRLHKNGYVQTSTEKAIYYRGGGIVYDYTSAVKNGTAELDLVLHFPDGDRTRHLAFELPAPSGKIVDSILAAFANAGMTVLKTFTNHFTGTGEIERVKTGAKNGNLATLEDGTLTLDNLQTGRKISIDGYGITISGDSGYYRSLKWEEIAKDVGDIVRKDSESVTVYIDEANDGRFNPVVGVKYLSGGEIIDAYMQAPMNGAFVRIFKDEKRVEFYARKHPSVAAVKYLDWRWTEGGITGEFVFAEGTPVSSEWFPDGIQVLHPTGGTTEDYLEQIKLKETEDGHVAVVIPE